MTEALWHPGELVAATGADVLQTGPYRTVLRPVHGIKIDSRQVQPDDLFIALQGTTDGALYMEDAIARGAAMVMLTGLIFQHDFNRFVSVPDTTQALADLGRAGRARFRGPVVAVTGSVGKTTTKEMLRLALSQNGAPHAAEASHNNHWGVPLTLARLPRSAPACIVEIGMNHRGEIAPLARLASPTVAVITSLGTAHIGQLGSREAIATEKASIADGLTADGIAVLPGDGPYAQLLAARAAPRRVIRFGTGSTNDCRLTGLAQEATGSVIGVTLAGRAHRFRLPAPGAHMAMNALAALAAVHAADMDVALAAAMLETFAPGAGRGAQRRLELADGTATLLDESYNASAASVRAALDVLALIPARRRLVALGDMRELGDHSVSEHTGLAGPVARVADLVFTCGIDMRHLHEAIPAERRAAHTETAAELAPLLAAELRPGDAVLVKGSNGSRMRDVIAALDALQVTV